MIVEIERTQGICTYEVPVFADTMTVMSVLDYIYANLDHSLAYYRHSSCCQSVCGRCLVKLDGTAVLACAAEVPSDTDRIHLSPASEKVVRDLVIEPV